MAIARLTLTPAKSVNWCIGNGRVKGCGIVSAVVIVVLSSVLNFSGEKQAATHVSLDQEYDVDSAAMWHRLEEQLVAAANRGVIPVNFQPTQYCLNSQTQNLRQPLAVMEGKMTSVGILKL